MARDVSKRRASNWRYDHSEKGKARRLRYGQTPARKAYQKDWVWIKNMLLKRAESGDFR